MIRCLLELEARCRFTLGLFWILFAFPNSSSFAGRAQYSTAADLPRLLVAKKALSEWSDSDCLRLYYALLILHSIFRPIFENQILESKLSQNSFWAKKTCIFSCTCCFLWQAMFGQQCWQCVCSLSVATGWDFWGFSFGDLHSGLAGEAPTSRYRVYFDLTSSYSLKNTQCFEMKFS